jgi:hypothetical protein
MGARIALALMLTAVAAVAPAATAQDVTPQELFGRTIREDPRTTTAIRRLLESGAGFVSARPLFADLTQDGKQDAVALVVTPGVAGAVAAYVLSADGSAGNELKVVYRTQRQYRLRATVADGVLTLISPTWRRGDDACCPSRLVERDYAWNRTLRIMQRRAERVLEQPAG